MSGAALLLQDLLLLGCVVGGMYGAWWAGWKLGMLAEPAYVLSSLVVYVRAWLGRGQDGE